jgi:iron complex outermembrane recepter protein
MKTTQKGFIALSLAISSASPVVASTQLEEIIVTAQKREQNLQDVPIAITAVTEDALLKASIEGTDELHLVTPGLYMSKQTTAFTPFLRGVGSPDGSVGTEPSVATYVDGVYMPLANNSVMNFNNVERVEVLKGPQGTLFGRNSTGGLVHVITKDPSAEPQLRVGIGYGNYETAEARLYGSAALTENVAANLSVYYKDQGEGFGTNPILGNDVMLEEDLSFHSKWLIDLGEKTQVRLSAYYTDTTTDFGNLRQSLPGTLSVNPTFTGGVPYTGDWYTIPSDIDFHPAKSEFKGVISRVDHEFRAFDFVSITSYRDDSQAYAQDQDGNQFPVVIAPISIGQQTLTQEFQFVSNSDGPYSWLLGLYYYDTSASYEPLDIILGFGPPAPGLIRINSFQNVESTAIFFENRWDITATTGITAGLRWTRDELQNGGNTRFAFPATAALAGPPGYNQEENFEEPTWRLSVDHRFSDSLMAYASYNRGYKMGHFDLVSTTGAGKNALEPEILDAYEIGFKSDLIDSRLRLNGAAFYYDYQEIQLSQIVVGGSTSLNAPSAEIQGVELEAQLVINDNFDLRIGVAVLDGEYDIFPNGPAFVPNPPIVGGNSAVPGGKDLSGNTVIRAPEMTLNLGGTYQIPTDAGLFAVSGNYYHNDGFYWDPENRIEEPAYDILNMDISWTSLDEDYVVRLWGRNLIDEEYSLFSSPSTIGDSYTPAPPRTFGVSLEYSIH